MLRQKFLLFRVYRFQDTKAYGELYDLYFDKLYRYVYFKMPGAEDAEELTSEVFLRGWEYATSSRVENASALFYRIARNLIADYYRGRNITEDLESHRHLQSNDNLAEKLMLNEESAALIKHLRLLKEEYRDVLIMKYLSEMSTSEIASTLEKSPGNVRVLLHRARRALREISQS